jgi:general secretion pathway protein H
VLSLGVVGGGDRPLKQERERIEAAVNFLREQASLQNREFGLRCFPGGYEFVVFDLSGAGWMRISDERLLATHELPPGLEISLRIDGRPVVLPKRDASDPVPQVMLSASGDLNLFELTVRRENTGPGFRAAPAETEDEVEFSTLDAGASG